MNPGNVVFTLLFLVALGFFLARLYLLAGMVLLGQGENRYDRLHERLKALLIYGFGQKRVVQRPFGINHVLLFWGFILLQIVVNIEFILNAVFPGFSLRFIGDRPYAIFGLLADVTSLIVLCAALAAIVRRAFFKPWYLEARAGSYVILALVALLLIGNFGMHVSSMSMGEEQTQFLPVSRLLSIPLMDVTPPLSWAALYSIFWWLHGLVLLVFLDYIPYSKHLHILTALVNCFFRRLSFTHSLPRMEFKKSGVFGVSRIVQFTWKDLYDLFSCTECGRCAHMCPATDTGKVLNPMKVVLEGKTNLLANGKAILRARHFDSFERADVRTPVDLPLISESGEASVQPEAIWDCTTCGACVQACPVFIEQFPKLLVMRRHLVMEKVDFPPELVLLFENIEQRSNPYGMAPAERGRWTENTPAVPLISDHRDAEYLFFVGCVASFNTRMRSVLGAVTTLLQKASVSFVIMGNEEPCCGDPMRRLGNEYMFDRMARANVERFNQYGVRKIITLCPHCYNSFKHDYPAFGAHFEVFHHTEVLSRLVAAGTLPAPRSTGERVVIHDPCYLGRYNGIYEQPREIVAAVTGVEPLEMERRREGSFCCGAGGGRLWMHESRGTRINTARTRQALATEPSIVATACPYCLVMMEDGLKDERAYGKVKAMDVAELLARPSLP